MRKLFYNSVFTFAMVCMLLLLVSCSSRKQVEYYSDKNNYCKISGVLSFINDNEEANALYLGFSELNPQCDDSSFKITGLNYSIIKSKGIMDKIRVGDKISFITAPRYFGDGYVMPIVSITVDGEEILEFEEGYSNLLRWLNEQ